MTKPSDIDFEILYGVFENAIYGGRIDNETDLRVLRCYLRQFFSAHALQNGTNGMPAALQTVSLPQYTEHLK